MRSTAGYRPLALHDRARNLSNELRVAERQFEQHGDEASFDRLVVLKQELEREQGTEALIEGFGLPSGRTARNF